MFFGFNINNNNNNIYNKTTTQLQWLAEVEFCVFYVWLERGQFSKYCLVLYKTVCCTICEYSALILNLCFYLFV